MAYLIFDVELHWFFWLCLLEAKAQWAIPYCVFISAFMFIQYTETFTSSLVFSMPILLPCSCSNVFDCSAISMMTCLSLQLHQSLPVHPWMSNMVTYLGLHYFCFKVIPLLWKFLDPLSMYLPAWLLICLLLLCMLVYQLCCWWSWCLYSYLLFPHLSFQSDFVMIANLLCIRRNLVCILNLCCVETSWVEFTAITETGLPCLSSRLQLVICGPLLIYLSSKTIVMEFFKAM